MRRSLAWLSSYLRRLAERLRRRGSEARCHPTITRRSRAEPCRSLVVNTAATTQGDGEPRRDSPDPRVDIAVRHQLERTNSSSWYLVFAYGTLMLRAVIWNKSCCATLYSLG